MAFKFEGAGHDQTLYASACHAGTVYLLTSGDAAHSGVGNEIGEKLLATPRQSQQMSWTNKCWVLFGLLLGSNRLMTVRVLPTIPTCICSVTVLN